MSAPDAGTTTTGTPDTIHPWERVVLLGMTGTGKSEAGLALLAEDPGQRLLIDVQDAYELGPATLADEAGYQEVYGDAREIDWSARTIRYVPRRAGRAARAEYDDLYAAVWARGWHFQDLGPLTVLLDESYGPTDANYAPSHLLLVLTQGRKKHIRHLAAAQRPAKIAPELLTSSEHLFLFDVGARRDDLDSIGQRFGWNGAEVGEALRDMADEHGYMDGDRFRCHGYLRHRLGRREVFDFPPLPAEQIERTRRHFVNNT